MQEPDSYRLGFPDSGHVVLQTSQSWKVTEGLNLGVEEPKGLLAVTALMTSTRDV